MQVPGPLRVVFDRFPLKTYPSSQESLPLGSKYSLRVLDGTPASKAGSFNLLIHNVHLTQVGESWKYIPTDPASLFFVLHLCHKNGLGLPHNENAESNFILTPSSYLASSENELPLLVESNKGSSTTFVFSELEKNISASFSDSPASWRLFNSFLDNLVDLWYLTLIADVAQASDPSTISEVYCKIFYYSEEIQTSSICARLVTLKTIGDAHNFHQLSKKYPTFHANSIKQNTGLMKLLSKSVGSLTPFQDDIALKQLYLSKLAEFRAFVPPFMAFLETAPTDGLAETLRFKFASFVACVKFFLPDDNHLSRLIRFQCSDAVEFSMEVLSRF